MGVWCDVAMNEFVVPDDLSELLGPSPAPPPPPLSPPVAADLSGTAGGSARAALERGRLLFGWRLNAEQRALRDQLDAEVHVGAILDRLTRVGARVLHDRLGPDGSHLDHVVISASGVHIVESIATSKRAPLTVAGPGAPRIGVFPLQHRLRHLHAVNALVADKAADALNVPARFTVYPLAAVTGTPPTTTPKTFYGVDVVSAALSPGWITRLPAAHSPLVVAALTDVLARGVPACSMSS